MGQTVKGESWELLSCEQVKGGSILMRIDFVLPLTGWR